MTVSSSIQTDYHELPPHISIIQAFAQLSVTVLDLDDLLSTGLDMLYQVFGYDLLAVLLVDNETGEPDLKAHQGPIPFKAAESLQEPITTTIDEGYPVNRTFEPEPHSQAVIRACLVVPLTMGRLVTGVLVLATSSLHHFSPAEEQLLTVFASQMTVGITNARLYQRMREQQQQELTRRQIATHLQQLSSIISATLRLDDVLRLILEHIEAIIPYHSALIMLLQGQNLTVCAARGFPESKGDALSVRIDPGGFYHRIIDQAFPAIFHDVSQDIRWRLARLPITEDVKALIGAPLIVKNRIIGVMTLHHRDSGYFDAADPELVHAYANQAGIAIDNAQAYEREHQKVRQFQTVAKIGRQVTAIHEVQPLLEIVIKRLHRDLAYEFVSIFLYQCRSDELLLKASSDILSPVIETLRAQISLDGEGVISTAARSGLPLLVNDISAFDGYFAYTGREAVKSELAIPLMTKGQLVGLLDLQSTQLYAFSPDDLILAQTIADQLAVAITTAYFFEERDRRIAELLAFSDIADTLVGPADLERTLSSVLARIKGLYQVTGVSLLVRDGEMLTYQTSLGLPRLRARSLPLGEGVAGWVVHTRQPLRFDEAAVTDARYRYLAGLLGFDPQAVLAVPIQLQERVIGVIEIIDRLDGQSFSAEDEVVLMFIASVLAVVMENAGLIDELSRKAEEMIGLFEISQSLTNLDLSEVLRVTVRQVTELLQAGSSTVYLADEAGQLVVPGAAYAADACPQRPVVYEIGQGTVGWVLEQKVVLRLDDIRRDHRFNQADLPEADVVSVLTAPLIARGELIGVLEVFSKDETCIFSIDDETLLTTLSGQAAMAIYNARLHHETTVRLAEVATLYTLAYQVAAELDVQRLLDNTVNIVRMALDSLGCSIYLLDSKKLTLGAQNGHLSLAGHAWINLVIQQTVDILKPINLQTPADLATQAAQAAPTDLQSLVLLPLQVHGKLLGVLAVYDNRPFAFSHNEGQLLSIIATQVASALDNSKLFNDLQSHARSLETALTELQEVNRLQNEFVQIVSHELRTPLTFIKAYVDLILEESLGEISPSVKHSLEIVARRTNDLNHLVNDIISHQQLDTGGITFHQVDLREVIMLSSSTARPVAEKHDLTLVAQLPQSALLVEADPNRMSQVLDNLIGNAIKFTMSGGQITISAWQDDNSAMISVADTGIGITAHELDKIFGRFYQVDASTTRKYGGTGLGLAIVKQIVEAHNGRITVTSEPGQGSEFLIVLPVIQP